MQNTDGINIFRKTTMEANCTDAHAKEKMQTALTQIKAGKETEDILDSYGIEYLDTIIMLNDKDLTEAKLTISQATALRQSAIDAFEETMKRNPQWKTRKAHDAHNGKQDPKQAKPEDKLQHFLPS